MAAFFRGLLLFLFGAIAGAAGILFLTPSFQVDIRRGDTAIKPLELGPRVAQPTPAPVAVPSVAPKPAAPAPTTVATAKPAASPTPAPAPAPVAVTAEPALDFAAISRYLILWPTAVTVKTPTTVVVNVEGQKPQDLALEAGAVLQLTRVLPTGQLEVRAKGTKFEIKSTSTDFAAELGKRVSELVAKGTKFDSPYPAASAVAAAPEASAPSATTVASATPVVAAPKRPLTLAERIDVLYGRKAPEPVVPTPVSTAPAAPAAPVVAAPATPEPAPAATPVAVATPVVAKPKLPLTLAQRIDILYGRKPPEPEATPAEVAPAATSIAPATAPAAPPAATATAPAPTTVVSPAPAVTPAPDATKVEEKGKDLDRKMNQLFK